MGFNPNRTGNGFNGGNNFSNGNSNYTSGNLNNKAQQAPSKGNKAIVTLIMVGILMVGIVAGAMYFMKNANKGPKNDSNNQGITSTEMIEIEVLDKK